MSDSVFYYSDENIISVPPVLILSSMNNLYKLDDANYMTNCIIGGTQHITVLSFLRESY